MKKRNKKFGMMVTLLLAIGVLTACSPKVEEPVDDQNTDIEAPIEVEGGAENENDGTFETSLTLSEVTDVLNIQFTLSNPTAEEKTITYPSGQTFDYQIFNEAGENVYTWSANKSFIQALSEVSLAADEDIVYEDQFDYKNMSGEAFGAGTYLLVFNTSFYLDEEMQTYVETESFLIK